MELYCILANSTTMYEILNVSGYSKIDNNPTLLSSLNISGRTIIGSEIYNYIDSVFEVSRN